VINTLSNFANVVIWSSSSDVKRIFLTEEEIQTLLDRLTEDRNNNEARLQAITSAASERTGLDPVLVRALILRELDEAWALKKRVKRYDTNF
jgi:hypothetical protein